jgi:rRNA-processing protein FCF1
MPHLIFPDTNVFLHCRALQEIPWKDVIDTDDLEILIGAQVVDEIDDLKNNGNRRRARRARTTNSLFAEMLASGNSLVLRDSGPRVTLRFAPLLPPKREAGQMLDLTRPDDRLIDEVMRFRLTEPTAQILSGDTGMKLRAPRHGVPVIPVPESWLLPPEKDERDLKINSLEVQVAALQSTEAMMSLSFMSENGLSLKAIDGSMAVYPDLTNTDIDQLIEAIQQVCPEVKAFEPPRESAAAQLGVLSNFFEAMGKYRVPTAEQISAYQAAYKKWIEKLREQFEQLGSLLNVRQQLRKFKVSLANTSSRPADLVLVELKVHGEATLLASVRNDVPDLIAHASKLPEQVTLSAPPKPPKGEFMYEAFTRNSVFGFDQMDFATQLRSHMPNPVGIHPSIQKRDRHEFYRRETNKKPKAAASFACEEFRHQQASEVFNLWVFVPIQNNAKARLHVRASARNMAVPVDLYVPIDLERESRSTYEIAANWRIKEDEL